MNSFIMIISYNLYKFFIIVLENTNKMFYDLSNSPVSNIRRQKRVFNFKTSTAD